MRQNIRMNDSFFDPDAVRAKMKEMRVSQTSMADLLDLPSQSAFSNMLKGKRRVTVQEAETTYRFLGLPIVKIAPDLVNVPIIGFTSAGNWREAVTMPLGHMPIPAKQAGARAFVVQVQGDSMDRMFPDGSYVVIDPDQKELRAGSCYLLQNGDHEATLKCYQRDPARFVPMSHNDQHKPFAVSEHEFAVIGRVTWQGSPVS